MLFLFEGSVVLAAELTWLILASLFTLQQSQIVPVASHDFQCPAQIQVDGAQLSLAGLNVFEGPIEDRVALAPEQPPGEPGVMR